MKPSGNTVLITGGGAGIGLALAVAFLHADNKVIICGRTKATLDSAKDKYPKLHSIAADVSTEAGREILSAEIAGRFPDLNVLVNNAGIYSMTDIMHPDYIGTLENELSTNLVAPMALIQKLMPILEKQAQAAIVNVTTGYVFIPSAQASAYSASKTGLRAITQSLRFNLRKTSIRIVEVIPPAVNTQMNKGKNITLMNPDIFAQKVFRGLVKGEQEIVVGVSKAAKLLSRIAPKFAFNKINSDEEKQRIKMD
jgi:uncharacterized oxidoreductase